MPKIKKDEIEETDKSIESKTKKTSNKTVNSKKEIIKSGKVANNKKKAEKVKEAKADKITKKSETVKKTRKAKVDKKVNDTKIVENDINEKIDKLKLKNKKVSVSKAKNATKNKATKTENIIPKIEVLEYYDLPYRYNQTVVKVLYQTPNILFIYWDISDETRKKFAKQYGDNFFNDTKPVLIIHNDTLHYSFEIEIDDFANSWYLHVNDANCKYAVELGRRPKYYNNEKHIDLPNNYLYITYSNEIESPNDHVLFNKNMDTVYFKDVKTNIVTAQAITSLSFIRNMGKIYSLYDLQTNFNKNNWLNSNHWQLDLNNPSSGNPSSTFK